MKVVWLKGDYTKKRERQQQAKIHGCRFVISFHFNSFSDPTANGAEVYYNEKGDSEFVAQGLMKVITQTLKVKSRKVASAKGSRASFINAYPCPAVLIEPCFVSNPNEAKLLHDVTTMRKLGEGIADLLLRWLPFDSVVGLDVGHKFKTSSPNDRGAACVLGDTEADHAEQLAKIVAAKIEATMQKPIPLKTKGQSS